MQWQPMLYGLGLNQIRVSPYTNHYHKGVGFGTPSRTSGFYVKARENPLNEPNTAVNVLDNDKGIDHQADKTKFGDPKINHSAEDVPGYAPEDDKEHFKPIATSQAELKEVVACKKKAQAEIDEAGGCGDDLRVTKVPTTVVENKAGDASVDKKEVEKPPPPPHLQEQQPTKKSKKVYKGPTHRLRVTR